MASHRRLLVAVGVVVGCASVAVIVLTPGGPAPADRPGSSPAARDGTPEDPYARASYDWLRLRNPATGAVPRGIGTREVAFVRSLALRPAKGRRPLVREWSHRGPYAIGGRTKALALDVLDEDVILAGGTSGGMWKSSDGGQSWRKTTAPDQVHTVSCIAQNTWPGREHIWYHGTGEGISVRGSSAAGPMGTNAFDRGDGIFKSTDGGESWVHLAATVSGTPTRDDPFDFVFSLAGFGPDGVLAATASGLWASTNGGATWETVLDIGGDRRVTEIARSPGGTFYATMGGERPQGGIYRSLDGLSWEDMTPPDWPLTTIRTVVGVVPSNEDLVFFFTCEDNLKTHLYRHEEGVGWTDLRANLPWGGDMTTYGGNMLLVGVKPDDEDTLFIGTTGLFRSMDGGQSFETIGGYSQFHVDQHALVFYPSDARRMIVGNDGGLFRTDDNEGPTHLDPTSGERRIDWESLNRGYLTTQFYTVALDHETEGSELLAGGMQDNGCMFSASADPAAPWQDLIWGDGGAVVIADGGEYFYTSNAATLLLFKHWFASGQHWWTEITPVGAWHGLWLGPMLLDPFDTRIMYLPARRDLWRNSDLTGIPHVYPPTRTGVNWERLEHVDAYISALGMASLGPRRLYYGTNAGVLGYIDDPHQGQPFPVPLPLDTLPVMNQYAYVGCIAIDPRDPSRLLLVYPNYELLSIFLSEDGGQTWVPVAGNLEEHPDGTGVGPSVRWVAILYVHDRPVYFAATSAGLFSTDRLDGMSTAWVQEGAGTIGCVVVDMVDVRQSDGYVAVGTHGNGVYTATVSELPPLIHRHLRGR